MALAVHLPRPPAGGFLDALRSHLDHVVELHTDPPRGGYEILVEGRPTREQVSGARVVIVPYAGVPPATRELMHEFPEVPLHNLHHNAPPTAELAVALLLAAAKRLLPMDRALRKGDWSPRYADERPFLCAGKTAVVLGYGEIGRRVATACRSLGMRVLATRRGGPLPDAPDEVFGPESLHDLLPRAEALVLCLPWTKATDGLLGRKELGRLPRGAVLVNIARGRIVDEPALYDELRAGRISAGLDVWYRYPESEEGRTGTPPSELPFGELDNVVLSPHRGGLTDETEDLRARHLASMLNRAARGEALPHRVDIEEGY